MSTAELRRLARERIRRLSSERLQVAVDFLAYLDERQSNEATDELLRIPGFLKAFQRAKKQADRGELTPARGLRRK